MIALHGALSPAEMAVAQSLAAAAQMQEFRPRLFTNSSDALRQEIKRITGVEVGQSTAEVETMNSAARHVFTSGTMVQAFLLPRSVPLTRGAVVDRPINHENGGPAMLVLSRKQQEAVVVGGSVGFERLLQVTVLAITGGQVRLGFAVDTEVSVHR